MYVCMYVVCKYEYRFFPGVKRPGRDVDHPTLSSAEVKERLELYLYFPSGPSHICMYVYMCVYVRTYVCIYVCMYVCRM